MSSLFDGAHAHLLVNHFPILGLLFAMALLVASYMFAPDRGRAPASIGRATRVT